MGMGVGHTWLHPRSRNLARGERSVREVWRRRRRVPLLGHVLLVLALGGRYRHLVARPGHWPGPHLLGRNGLEVSSLRRGNGVGRGGYVGKVLWLRRLLLLMLLL